MPITAQIEQSKQLTKFIGTGELSFEEVLKNINSFYNAGTTSKVMWDLRQASAKRISSSQVGQIAQLAKKLRKYRKKGRTAIVSTIDITFGLARMLEILTSTSNENHLYEIKAFRDIRKASEWLNMTGEPNDSNVCYVIHSP